MQTNCGPQTTGRGLPSHSSPLRAEGCNSQDWFLHPLRWAGSNGKADLFAQGQADVKGYARARYRVVLGGAMVVVRGLTMAGALVPAASRGFNLG